MAFFEDLTKKTKDLAYVAADKAKDVAAVAADKAKDAAELTRISMAIAGEQREIDKKKQQPALWDGHLKKLSANTSFTAIKKWNLWL